VGTQWAACRLLEWTVAFGQDWSVWRAGIAKDLYMRAERHNSGHGLCGVIGRTRTVLGVSQEVLCLSATAVKGIGCSHR
jgi:hypothetical protein